MALLHWNRLSPILAALHRQVWHFDTAFTAPQSPLRPVLDAPLFHYTLFTSLPVWQCSAWMAAPLDRRSSTPIGAHWPGFAPLNTIPSSSIIIGTPLAHPALHIRHSSFPGGAPLFPPKLSYCLSSSILIHCVLTSQLQHFRYHKSTQTTLEFNFTNLSGSNHSEILGVPSSSLLHG